MEIVYFLVPASILLALIFFGGYVWAVRSGQFDDLDTPAHRILGDDEQVPGKKNFAEQESDV